MQCLHGRCASFSSRSFAPFRSDRPISLGSLLLLLQEQQTCSKSWREGPILTLFSPPPPLPFLLLKPQRPEPSRAGPGTRRCGAGEAAAADGGGRRAAGSELPPLVSPARARSGGRRGEREARARARGGGRIPGFLQCFCSG